MTNPDTPDLIANLEFMSVDLAIQAQNLAQHLKAEHAPDWQAALAYLDAASAKLRTLKVQYAKAA